MWGQYIYRLLQPCGANTFTVYCSHVGPIHLPSTVAMWGQYIYRLLQPCGANTFTVYCSHVGPIHLPSTAAMWGQYIYRLLQPCGANTFTVYCSHVGPIHLPSTAAMWGQYIYRLLQPCGANIFTVYCSHVGPIHLPSTVATWGQYIYRLLQPCGANTFTVYCSHVGPIHLPSTAAMWGQYIYRLLQPCGANTFTANCSHGGGQYIYRQLQPCGANTFTINCSHVGPIHLPPTAAMRGQYIYHLLHNLMCTLIIGRVWPRYLLSIKYSNMHTLNCTLQEDAHCKNESFQFSLHAWKPSSVPWDVPQSLSWGDSLGWDPIAGRVGFDRGCALARLVLLFCNIQCGEQVGQEPQDMNDGQLIGGVWLERERKEKKKWEVVREGERLRPIFKIEIHCLSSAENENIKL